MFSVFKNSGKIIYGQKDFIVDLETDVPALPVDCSVGSLAFVIDTSQYYMLNHSKQWIKVTLQSGGGTDIESVIYNGGIV